MEIKYSLDVYIQDDYQTEPDRAEVIITPALIKRIRKLNKIVKELEVWRIQEFDYTPVWMVQTDDDTYKEWEEGYVDCLTLNVEDNSFNWEGTIKHTNITITTENISMKGLKELNKVLKTPKKDLPLLLTKLEFEKSKEVLERRLKGE